LKAFRGYAKDSDDVSALLKAVNKIFWSESKKIYGKYMPSGAPGYSPAMLVTVVVAKHDDVTENIQTFWFSYSTPRLPRLKTIWVTTKSPFT